MWANLNLLFWLSLIPFSTAWMDDHSGAALPIAIYGAVLLLCAVSWRIMQKAIVHTQGASSPLRTAIHADFKGAASVVIYVVAIALANKMARIAWALMTTGKKFEASAA